MVHRAWRATLMSLVLACAALAADISGAWQFTVENAKGKGTPSFEFKQDGENLTGTYAGKFGKAPVTGSVKGNQVEFSFDAPSGKFQYKGTIDGDSMKGEYELVGTEKGTFTATKK